MQLSVSPSSIDPIAAILPSTSAETTIAAPGEAATEPALLGFAELLASDPASPPAALPDQAERSPSELHASARSADEEERTTDVGSDPETQQNVLSWVTNAEAVGSARAENPSDAAEHDSPSTMSVPSEISSVDNPRARRSDSPAKTSKDSRPIVARTNPESAPTPNESYDSISSFRRYVADTSYRAEAPTKTETGNVETKGVVSVDNVPASAPAVGAKAVGAKESSVVAENRTPDPSHVGVGERETFEPQHGQRNAPVPGGVRGESFAPTSAPAVAPHADVRSTFSSPLAGESVVVPQVGPPRGHEFGLPETQPRIVAVNRAMSESFETALDPEEPATELRVEEVENIVEQVRARTSRPADAEAAAVTRNAIPTPPMRTEGKPVEKFAAAYQHYRDTASTEVSAAEKNSLVSENKYVRVSSPDVGIATAISEAPMPALAPSAPVPSTPVERVTGLAHPVSFESLVQEDAGAPTAEIAQAARRSVESAVAVAEHYGSGDKRAVTLQFSVSGVDLGVRVEVRANGVHTTFKTDSPELRAALAQEWQAIAGTQFADRSVRMADPVFTSASSTPAAQSDTGGQNQRGAPHGDRERATPEFANAAVPYRSRSPDTTPVVKTRIHPPATAGRLHTFA